MTRTLAILLAAAACTPPPSPPPPPKPAATLASRTPRREALVCFPCHSLVKFEKGPPFAHSLAAHKAAGHCHTCHQGTGHEPRDIDRAACLACHERGSPELTVLASGERGR